jgi:hypothetical protein
MKYLKTLAVALVLMATHMSSAQALDKWPTMKEYHAIMSRTFHPAESGDFKPLREYAQALADKSMDLTKNDIPASIKTEALMDKVKTLQIQSQSLAKYVKANASDDELKKLISQAHDTFHEIVGMCQGEKH